MILDYEFFANLNDQAYIAVASFQMSVQRGNTNPRVHFIPLK